jgi:hypothetical protein
MRRARVVDVLRARDDPADLTDEFRTGTIRSSSPWSTCVGTSSFFRSSVKSVSD